MPRLRSFPAIVAQAGAALALGAAALAACSTLTNDDVGEFARHQSRNSLEVFRTHLDETSASVLSLKLDAQEDGHTCGAHAVAIVAEYWASFFPPAPLLEARAETEAQAQTVGRSGAEIAALHPPSSDHGYTALELHALLNQFELSTIIARASLDQLENEIGAGRPVIVPVRLPAAYVQTLTLLPISFAGVDQLKSYSVRRVASLSQISRIGLINHYWILAGFDEHSVVVLDPALGYRTLSRKRFERYRKAYANAAIIIGGPRPSGVLHAEHTQSHDG